MVNATIQITAETSKALDIIKAVNKLKDKGAAVDFLAKHGCPYCLGKKLKPEAAKRIQKAAEEMDEGKGIPIDNWDAHFSLQKIQSSKSRKNTSKTRSKSTTAT